MKILALYTEETLSLHRRIKAPYSALSTQGDSFSFLQVDNFSAGIGFSADVTVLENWVLSEEELEELGRIVLTRLFVMDCSDPLLLQNHNFRRALRMVHLVTVPNEWMKKEVRLFNNNVAILPSTMNKEHYFSARSTKLPQPYPPVIGCLGPYDWYLVRDALLEIKARYPKVLILGGKEAEKSLSDIMTGVTYRPLGLPDIIYHTTFGLCPYDGDHGWDSIWEWEYGILCRPTITLRPPLSKNTEQWITAIETFVTDQATRVQAGNTAYEHANVRRSTRVTHLYRDAYRKKLPHLSRA